MSQNKQDQALDAFLETKAYDRAEEALFQVVKAAFEAGWKAAREEQEN